jgi:hypothetical protein
MDDAIATVIWRGVVVEVRAVQYLASVGKDNVGKDSMGKDSAHSKAAAVYSTLFQ